MSARSARVGSETVFGASPSRSKPGTRLIAGIDEAGLGPLLGPLTIGYSAFHVPPASRDDLWRLLSRVVSREPAHDAKRLVVADSKRVFTRNPRGRRRLESTALAFLARAESTAGAPRSGRELIESSPRELQPDRSLLARHPWYSHLPATLPADTEPEALEDFEQRLGRELERSGVRLACAGVRVVPAGELNASFRDTESKNVTLWQQTSSILRYLWDRHGRDGVELVIDRHGGRTHYDGLLARSFPFSRLDVLREGKQGCEYRLEGPVDQGDERTRRMHLTIVERAEESSFAVALASCLAKYVRETCMQAFNAYFEGLQPGLKPTAGYTTDGRRWLAEAKRAVERADLDPEVLVRQR